MRAGVMILTLALMATPALARSTGSPTPPLVRNVSAQVELRAAREAALQAERDARFDAQVRRITGSICASCLTPPASPRRR